MFKKGISHKFRNQYSRAELENGIMMILLRVCRCVIIRKLGNKSVKYNLRDVGKTSRADNWNIIVKIGMYLLRKDANTTDCNNCPVISPHLALGREHDRGHAFPKFDHVVGAGEDDDGDVLALEALLQLQDEEDVLKAGEAGAAGGLGLLGVQREGVVVDARVGDVGVELVGLHEAEVGRVAHGDTLGGVEHQAGGDQGVLAQDARVVEPVVGVGLALAADGPDELNARVGKGQLNTADARVEVGVQGRHLGGELLKPGGRKAVTLQRVEVHLGGVQVHHQVVLGQHAGAVALDDLNVGAGHDDAVLQGLELHPDRGRGHGHGHQRERVTGRLCEVEGQGHPQLAGLVREGLQIFQTVELTNHLGQALAGLAAQLLPHEQVVVVQRVHGLLVDLELRFADEELADSVRPSGPGLLVAQGRAGGAACVRRAIRLVVAA